MKPPIPWLRVFVEGVVIVVSIRLAFGIDAWWEGSQDAQEAHELLLGLREEFTLHQAEIDRNGTRWEAHSQSVIRLLTAIRSGSTPRVESVDSMLYHVIYAGTFDPGSGVRDALIASGKLELLDSSELRAQLSGWQSVVDELRDNELAMRTFVLNTVFPYLARAGVPVTRTWTVSRSDIPPSAMMTVDEVEAVYRALLRDPEFESLVSQRSGWFNTREYREAGPYVDRVLALVEEELGRYE